MLKRKGDTAVIIWLAVDVALTALILIVILNMFTAVKPYNQIALANFDKLSTAIQKACIEGNDQHIEFTIDQAKPFSFVGDASGTLNVLFDIGKKVSLAAGGDPAYVVYFEAFPPGDAWAWEEFLKMPSRNVIYYVPSGNLNIGDKIENAREKLRTYLANQIGENPNPFVVGNIILDDLDVKISKSTSPMFGAGSVGKWNIDQESLAQSEGEVDEQYLRAFYGFVEFFSIDDTQQSLLKYRACGENSLCMKTNTGVLRAPLTNCAIPGGNYNQDGDLVVFFKKPKYIDYAMVKRTFLGVWAGRWKDLFTALGLRSDDIKLQNRVFGFASPCTAKLKIESPGVCICRKGTVKKYPIFKIVDKTTDSDGVEDFNLLKVGEYVDCEDWEHIVEGIASGESDIIRNCIQITYDYPDGAIIDIDTKDTVYGDFCTSYPGLFPPQETANQVLASGTKLELPPTSSSPYTWVDRLNDVFSTYNPFWY